MKRILQTIIVGVCFFYVIQFNTLPAFAQAMMGDTLYFNKRGDSKTQQVEAERITRAEAGELFRHEIQRLQVFAPDMLRSIAMSQMVEQVSLFPDGGEILLFVAADMTHQNIDEFYQEFPILATIAGLKYIGDLDQDGSNELVGCQEYESTAINVYVFKRLEHKVTRYSYNMEAEYGNGLHISVRTKSTKEVVIVGRTIGGGHLPVKGQNRSIEYESVYEMEVKFTGGTFEIIMPMKRIRQELILDE